MKYIQNEKQNKKTYLNLQYSARGQSCGQQAIAATMKKAKMPQST